MSLQSTYQHPSDPLIAASLPKAAIQSDVSIPVFSPEIAVVKIAEHLKAAQMELAALRDVPKPVEALPWVEPSGWAQAVRIAVAQLKKNFVVPPDDSDPVLMAMAQELAVFLCAYGKLDDDADLAAAEEKAANKGSNPTPLHSRGLDAA